MSAMVSDRPSLVLIRGALMVTLPSHSNSACVSTDPEAAAHMSGTFRLDQRCRWMHSGMDSADGLLKAARPARAVSILAASFTPSSGRVAFDLSVGV